MGEPSSLHERLGQGAVVVGLAVLTIITTEGTLRAVIIGLLAFVAVIGGLALVVTALMPRFLAGQFAKAASELTTEQLRHRLLEHPYLLTRGDGRALAEVGQVRTALRQIREGHANTALDRMHAAYDGIGPFFAQAERVIGLAGGFAPHAEEVIALLEELARRDGG